MSKDEITDLNNLNMWLEAGDKRYQNQHSDHDLQRAVVVSYLSHFMSLQPGDGISTGTPPGVDMGQKPNPIDLKAGQVMKRGIAGFGEQTQKTEGGVTQYGRRSGCVTRVDAELLW